MEEFYNLKSMTGYGSSKMSFHNYDLSAQISSVNSKNLDIYIKSDDILSEYEIYIRNIIKSYAQRGKINLILNVKMVESDEADASFSENKLLAYKKDIDSLCQNTGLKNDLRLFDYLKFPGVMLKENDDSHDIIKFEDIEICLEDALKNFIKSREDEGKSLSDDILARIGTIRNILTSIEDEAEKVPKEIYENLLSKIKEISHDIGINSEDERIYKEAALYAEKCDITEEIIRLKAHIENFDLTCKAELTNGKKLDFIAQEMLRETNTIGSKSVKTAVSTAVIDIKSELEKIRQQIQNIE